MRCMMRSVFRAAVVGSLLVACQSPKGNSPPGAQPQDLRSRCEQACQAASDRTPPQGSSCGPDLADCRDRCVARAQPAGEACRTCVIGNIIWSRGGCDSRECICDGLFIAAYDGHACGSVCGAEQRAEDAAKEAQLRARDARPRPPNTGRAPDLLERRPGLGQVTRAVADGTGAVWLLGHDGPQEDRLEITALDDHLAPALRLTHAAFAPAPGALYSMAPAREGGVWLLGRSTDYKTMYWTRLAADGAIAPPRLEPGMDNTYVRAMRVLPDGRLLLAESRGELSLRSADGALIWRGPIVDAGEEGTLAALAVDARGDWFVGGMLGPDAFVRKLAVNYSDQGVPRPQAQWTTRLRGNDDSQLVQSLDVTPGGEVVAAGQLRWRKQSTRHSVDYNEPFVALLGGGGEIRWVFNLPADTLNGGAFNEVFADRSGGFLAVGTQEWWPGESRAPLTPPCPPEIEGDRYCRSLSVMKLTRDGALAWEYQHRSEESGASAAALDAQGRLVVLGRFSRLDQDRTMILRFDQP
jgi:hypothetical protein